MSLSNQSEVVKTPFLTRKQLRQRLNERGYVISEGYFSRLPAIAQHGPRSPLGGVVRHVRLGSRAAWAEGQPESRRPAINAPS
jgi:hypothetical protein